MTEERQNGRRGGKNRKEEYERQKFEILAEEMERIKEGEENWFTVVCLPLFPLYDCLTHTLRHTHKCVKL